MQVHGFHERRVGPGERRGIREAWGNGQTSQERKSLDGKQEFMIGVA